MKRLAFALIAIVAVVTAFSTASARELQFPHTNPEVATSFAIGENAIAVATDIAVSFADPTDLVSYIAEQIAVERARADAEIAKLRAELLPPIAAAYIGWSADATFTAAEFKAGTHVTGATHGAVPSSSISGTFAHLGLWLAGDAWDGITGISLEGAIFGLNLFGDPVALTIDGVAGKYRFTVSRQGHALLSGDDLRWSTD